MVVRVRAKVFTLTHGVPVNTRMMKTISSSGKLRVFLDMSLLVLLYYTT